MSGLALHVRDALSGGDAPVVGTVGAPTAGTVGRALLDELGPVLFASLRRSDQRDKGAQYVRGLIDARGRKTIRNIAAVVGGAGAEQSLHHFVAGSTWDWVPVRQALAQYLARVAPPQAYVVRPMVVPRAGQHLVGVDRRFVPALGQVCNVQQAVGVWAASGDLTCPVNWRLHLPQAWLDNEPRRSRALIPDGVDAETLGDCALEAVLGLPGRWGLPVRPVVLDARDADGLRTVRRLRAARMPVLARIDGGLPLVPAEAAASVPGAGRVSADRLVTAVRENWRPVVWSGHSGGTRAVPVWSLRVRVPAWAGRLVLGPPGEDLLLLAFGGPARGRPVELWLTDMVDLPPAALFRLTRLTHRVERDFERISDRVGIRDFAGRSFDGWHRHITLASAAHAVTALAAGAVVGPCPRQRAG
ncbi:IS701 family transposase [Kitasatospora sp. NPDC004614]|uniref:IS701 family transposase n=1 Tax=unclassified Kitasatospora TaxID=2633591 RepID=UPI003683765D